MSHSTVLVITKPGVSYEEALKPFDENISVEPYVDCDKAGFIQNYKDNKKRWEDQRSEYLNDPIGYTNRTHKDHLVYLMTGMLHDGIPELSFFNQLSDDEIWDGLCKLSKSHKDKWGEADFDENGDHYTTYNPKSKWDWYTVGGRWDRTLITKKGKAVNECYVSELNLDTNTSFAILDADGNWHERGNMGWWGMVADEKAEDDWKKEWRSILEAADPEDRVTLVDVHI